MFLCREGVARARHHAGLALNPAGTAAQVNQFHAHAFDRAGTAPRGDESLAPDGAMREASLSMTIVIGPPDATPA
jgi:hypothetical protein